VSSEFILRVLADEHRQQTQYDPEAEPGIELSLDTTIAQWRDACDLVGWRQLGRALNARWRIDVADDEWRNALEPPRRRTLLSVCRLISDRAQLPQLVGRGYLGARCVAAAAFLGIQSQLAESGNHVRGLRPSTKLEPYLRNDPAAFLTYAARTSPGSLPPIQIKSPAYDRSIYAFVLSYSGCFVAAGFQQWWLTLTLAVLTAGAWVGSYISARFVAPRCVTLGSLFTFADYARCLAGVSPDNAQQQGICRLR